MASRRLDDILDNREAALDYIQYLLGNGTGLAHTMGNGRSLVDRITMPNLTKWQMVAIATTATGLIIAVRIFRTGRRRSRAQKVWAQVVD